MQLGVCQINLEFLLVVVNIVMSYIGNYPAVDLVIQMVDGDQ